MRDMGAGTALVRRVSLVVGLGAAGLAGGAVLGLSLLASAMLPWLVGALLLAAVVGVVLLGIHAGGHGWFVPVPVLALAGAWAIMASGGNSGSALAWAVAAFALAGAVAGAGLVLPAIAYRHASNQMPDDRSLVGASGVALSALTPRGIARVRNETWTVESTSGPLPAGAPVNVAKVESVRLLVWSEAGTVPGLAELAPADKEPNEQKEKS